MTLGDNTFRFSPDGSFFTTGDSRGLKNSSSQSYDIGPSATIGVWARPNSLPGLGQEEDVFRLYSGFTSNHQVVIGLNTTGGGITHWFYTMSDSTGATILTLIGTSEVSTGRWYHIIGCKNDTFAQRLFVNGVDENTVISGVPSTPDTSRSSSIGLDGRADTRQFDGDIHSVSLWNVAIPDESVRAAYNGGWKDFDLREDHPCYNEGRNLRHWWRLGQGITSTHTFGNDLITDWAHETPTIEQQEFSISLNGIDERLRSASALVDIGNVFTVSQWVRAGSSTATQIFMEIRITGLANTIDWNRVLNTTDWRVRLWDSGSTLFKNFVATNIMPTGSWVQLVVTFDGTAPGDPLRMYANGIDVTPGSPPQDDPGTMTDVARKIIVGADIAGASPFEGEALDLAIHDVVLTPAEVLTTYNNGNGGQFDLNTNSVGYSSAANLKHWFRMGLAASPAIGDDYAASITTAHDLDAESVNISNADRSTETPGDLTPGGISITEQVGTIEQEDVLGVGESPTGTSVDFDTADAISMPSAVPIGIGNEWTITTWIKPRNVLTIDATILCVCDPTPTNSAIIIDQLGAQPDDPLRVTVHSTTGTVLQQNDYNAPTAFIGVLTEDAWQHIGVTWDGVALNTYLDGFLLVPDATVSGAGVQEDSPRTIVFGASNLTGSLTDFWNGRMGHVGIWKTVLSVNEIRTLASKGQCLDIRYNTDSYTSAESLENYFKPGEDTLSLGRNFIDVFRPTASRILNAVTGTPEVAGDAPALPFVPVPIGNSLLSVQLDPIAADAEQYKSAGVKLMNIANAWSLSIWWKPSNIDAGAAAGPMRWAPLVAPNSNALLFFSNLSAIGFGGNRIFIENFGSAGNVIKGYLYDGVQSANTWLHIGVTWDGTDLKAYFDGVFKARNFFRFNNVGTMTDTARVITGVGTSNAVSDFGTTQHAGPWAIWNTVMTEAEFLTINTAKFAIDLRANSGNYVSSANLQHYWRPGFLDIGIIDLGLGIPKIDMDGSIGVDETDIVIDSPC